MLAWRWPLAVPIDNDHPVCSFMDTFHINAANQLDVVDNLSDTFKKHPQFWNSESFRAMAINVFVRIGTNMFFDKRTSSLGFIAQAIVVLENYNGSGYIESTYNFRVVATKFRDLLGSSSLRDELKFFRKRISCSCLKDMHLKMRKSCPKTGQCFGCDRTTERALLMVCSRCRISQYCSRRCQVEHWPIHKCKECGDYFWCLLPDTQEQQMIDKCRQMISRSSQDKEQLLPVDAASNLRGAQQDMLCRHI